MRRALVAVALLALSGCGTGGLGEQGATGNGEQLFKEKCQGCHTLAAAGARGTIGPNLDDAFRVPREEGFDETTIREVVLGQMRYPVPPMPEPDSREMFPPSEYTDAERDEAMGSIASYVASVAGVATAAAGGGGAAGGAGASASDPRALFSANCASCHILAAAGSSGTIGPNLDQSTIARPAIEQQIRRGGGGMPAFEGTLTDAQIQALARWVAENRRR